MSSGVREDSLVGVANVVHGGREDDWPTKIAAETIDWRATKGWRAEMEWHDK